jgi:DNA-binding MarR family transcriptional regulator
VWLAKSSQNQLSDLLAIDSTTLSRSLAPLIKNGWIIERAGKDRRRRWLRLSDSGSVRLDSAVPAWEQAQLKLQQQVGPELWNDLFRVSQQTLIASRSQSGEI